MFRTWTAAPSRGSTRLPASAETDRGSAYASAAASAARECLGFHSSPRSRRFRGPAWNHYFDVTTCYVDGPTGQHACPRDTAMARASLAASSPLGRSVTPGGHGADRMVIAPSGMGGTMSQPGMSKAGQRGRTVPSTIDLISSADAERYPHAGSYLGTARDFRRRRQGRISPDIHASRACHGRQPRGAPLALSPRVSPIDMAEG